MSDRTVDVTSSITAHNQRTQFEVSVSVDDSVEKGIVLTMNVSMPVAPPSTVELAKNEALALERAVDYVDTLHQVLKAELEKRKVGGAS